jgi:hypothetical protein
MTQEIIEMAREAGLETQDGFSESVFYFAKLIAEKEREALCQAMEEQNTWDLYDPALTAIQIIRARGQA